MGEPRDVGLAERRLRVRQPTWALVTGCLRVGCGVQEVCSAGGIWGRARAVGGWAVYPTTRTRPLAVPLPAVRWTLAMRCARLLQSRTGACPARSLHAGRLLACTSGDGACGLHGEDGGRAVSVPSLARISWTRGVHVINAVVTILLLWRSSALVLVISPSGAVLLAVRRRLACCAGRRSRRRDAGEQQLPRQRRRRLPRRVSDRF